METAIEIAMEMSHVDLAFYPNWWKFSMETHGLYLVSVNLPVEIAIEIAMEMNHVNLAFYQWKFSMEKHGFYIVSENLGIS